MRALLPSEWRLLQWCAREHERSLLYHGWIRYGVSPAGGFEWDTYRPLVTYGLLEMKESWMDIRVRLTEQGWKALTSTKSRAYEA